VFILEKKNLIKRISKIFISITLGLLVLIKTPNEIIATDFSSSSYKEKVTEKNLSEESQNKIIDELLGPEDNFPFLPDNHRDGGNPITRIGKINNLP
tara:strand:+ start:1254 stop:1544 length:291 start_codon:yes stop_codon:yes gene_type:complete